MTRSRHRSVRTVAVAMLATATVALGAAGPREQGRERVDPSRDQRPPGDEARETRVLALGPAGSLELKTLSGDISVVAGSGRDVTLEIIKRVRTRDAQETRAALDRVTVVVDHQGERAMVRAAYEGDRRSGPRVDVGYTITAPPGTRITASTLSGNLSIRNIKGDLSATLGSGSIDISGAGRISNARTLSGNVTVLDVTGDAGMSIATASGRVVLDRVQARRVDIEATSGSITARNVSAERVAIRSLSGPIEFTGDLAKGGRYEFQSYSASVTVGLGGPAGFELQASTFGGEIRAEPSLGLRAVTAEPRSLRGTSGDGSAVVVATTFNGNVVVRKK